MEIKKEEPDLLFQNPITDIFTGFNDSELLEIQQHFHQLNDSLVQVKTEIDNPEEPNAVGCNIIFKTENLELFSNNNDQVKSPLQLLRPQNYIQNACPVCRKSFSSNGKIKKHFMTHFYLPSNFKRKNNFFGRSLFICMFCGKICLLKHEIATHSFIHKTTKLLKRNGFRQNSLYCTDRIKTIPPLHTIKSEIDIEYNNFAIKQEPQESVPLEALRCEVCLREFKFKSNLNRHLIYHRKNHTCRICLKNWKSAYSLKRHQSSHFSLKLFKCELCLKYYKTKESLDIHKSLVCLKKSFQCHHCQKSYYSKKALHSHLCNRRSTEFNDCERIVNPKSPLNVQLATHTDLRPYKCKLCTKMFKYPQDLKRHDLYHTGEKPFECNLCQKRFRLKQHVTRHMYCHKGEKPFKCEVCSKTFTEKYSLVYHFRRHTNDTPFKCNICSNAYTEKKMLDYHVLSHIDKAFECAICAKRFKRKKDLKRHLIVHEQKKSITCAICGKCFTRKQSLDDHLRIHTGEKPYQCNLCLKWFSTRQNRNVHMRTHIK